MTQQDKIELKRLYKKINTLNSKIASIKKSIYPSGEKPTDKVAHLNFKLDQSIDFQYLEAATYRLIL